MNQQVTLNVLVDKDEDGVFVASVFELPGCVSDGDTIEEALEHVREAAEGYLEVLHEEGRLVPRGASATSLSTPVLRRLEVALAD